MLTKAPSLISSPKTSSNSPRSRSKLIDCVWCKYSASVASASLQQDGTIVASLKGSYLIMCIGSCRFRGVWSET